jgi:hypothetical protein
MAVEEVGCGPGALLPDDGAFKEENPGYAAE